MFNFKKRESLFVNFQSGVAKNAYVQSDFEILKYLKSNRVNQIDFFQTEID